METYFTIEELADYLKIAENVTIQNNIHSRAWRNKLTPDNNIRRNLLWASKTRWTGKTERLTKREPLDTLFPTY